MNPRHYLHNFVRAFTGPRPAWRLASKSRVLANALSDRIRDAGEKFRDDETSHNEKPIFILSAGWRTGSTLLQRMMMELNDDLLMWGEPFERANMFEGMSNQFRGFTKDWPNAEFFLDASESRRLSQRWVANLYPNTEEFVAAHRAFFNTLFGVPARRIGYSSWGVKEVRLTADHARYIRLIYPCARIIFLCRDPREAYVSYRAWFEAWFREWPDRVVATPRAFGANWAELMSGFLDVCEEVGAIIVRYEDLNNEAEVSRISKYVGRRMVRARDLEKIGSTKRKKQYHDIPLIDRALLEWKAGAVMRRSGYK